MSNENGSNGSRPQLTRIPLDRVWFTIEQDFPGGNAIQPSIEFGQPKVKGRQFFLGYFVPSYQVVDIEWYRNEDTDAEHFSIPVSAVKRMKRGAAKR